MRDIRCRALTLETRREVLGYYCKVEGKHYIIPDSACYLYSGSGYQNPGVRHKIMGLIEVDPETAELIEEAKNER